MARIIDMHIHIHPMPTKENGLKMPEVYEAETRKDLSRLGIPPEDQAAEAVRRMDAAGVDAAIVVNPYHEPESGHIRTNKSVYDAIAPFKGRLYALAGTYIHPTPDLKELETAITEYGFRGIKMNVGGARARPSDFDLLDPLYKKLIELDVPALFHPGPGFTGGLPTFGYDMRDYYDLAKRHPELRIVIAHGGHGTIGGPELALTIVRSCPNVYLEVSGLLYRSSQKHLSPSTSAGFWRGFTHNLLYPEGGKRTPEMEKVWLKTVETHTESLVATCNAVPGKIMYGTDLPFIDRWDMSVDLYRDALTDPAFRDAVLGGTAAEVFRLN